MLFHDQGQGYKCQTRLILHPLRVYELFVTKGAGRKGLPQKGETLKVYAAQPES